MGVQPISVPKSIAGALKSAGDRSGVDFDYLLQTAIRESSLNPSAKARTSSATGLFQFLNGTWLMVMKEEGPRLGYQQYADAITRTSDGDYVIADKKLRQDILALREDPRIAADLAAAFTRSNGSYLEERFGRMPSPGELYIAHFLGARGAETFFTAALKDPDQLASKLFPRQAKANPSIFYEAGAPRTLRQVYRALVAKHEGGPAVSPGFAAQQFVSDQAGGRPGAAQRPGGAAEVIPSRFTPEDMSFTALFSTEATSDVVKPRVLMTPPSPSASPSGDADGEAAARSFFNMLVRP